MLCVRPIVLIPQQMRPLDAQADRRVCEQSVVAEPAPRPNDLFLGQHRPDGAGRRPNRHRRARTRLRGRQEPNADGAAHELHASADIDVLPGRCCIGPRGVTRQYDGLADADLDGVVVWTMLPITRNSAHILSRQNITYEAYTRAAATVQGLPAVSRHSRAPCLIMHADLMCFDAFHTRSMGVVIAFDLRKIVDE